MDVVDVVDVVDNENAPSGGDDRSYSVRAVERVCRILDLLQSSPSGITLGQVVATTELPKTSAFRYLWTLEQHRYVERDPQSGTYRLGVWIVGMRFQQFDVLTQRSQAWIDRLRDELGETVNLGVLEGNHITYLHVSESSRSVRLAARVGDREPIHSTALGKALAAKLPEERVRSILAQEGMPRRTDHTIVDVDDYLYELRRVRRLGVAVDNGENEIDGRCAAVAIEGIPVEAALSVSAPAARFPPAQVEVVAQRLREVADGISGELRSLMAGLPDSTSTGPMPGVG